MISLSGERSIMQSDTAFIGKPRKRIHNYLTSTVSLQNSLLSPFFWSRSLKLIFRLYRIYSQTDCTSTRAVCVPCWNASALWKANARETVVCLSNFFFSLFFFFFEVSSLRAVHKTSPDLGRDAWTSEVTRWHHSVPVFALQSVTLTKCLLNFPKTYRISTHRSPEVKSVCCFFYFQNITFFVEVGAGVDPSRPWVTVRAWPVHHWTHSRTMFLFRGSKQERRHPGMGRTCKCLKVRQKFHFSAKYVEKFNILNIYF